MATSIPCHARSISLPSRPHPIKPEFDEHLSRLRSSESASISSSSSITHKLNTLKYLYVCVDDLLLIPSNVQRASSWVDQVLEESLTLLDVCSSARDVLSQIKERVHDIQSVVRRRCSGDLSVAKEAASYIKCRKEAKRVVKCLLKHVRNVHKKCSNNHLEKNNGESVLMVDTLMKLEAATAEVLESLLAYIDAGPKKHSLVSKLMGQAQLQKEARSCNEFGDLDAAVQSMISQKNFIMTHLECVQTQMGDLELTIQDFDQVLESLFRHFVKSRANLLNILSH